MAEPKIKTINLFKALTVNSGSAGGTSNSDAIDLRDISKQGDFSLSYTVAAVGGAATCGSSKFYFLGCPVYDGTYIMPTGGTCATIGNGGGSDIIAISPPVMPFMKIRVICGTSALTAVTADLHVR